MGESILPTSTKGRDKVEEEEEVWEK